jgi:hypothetical protein
MKLYYKLPKDILSNRKIRTLLKLHGYIGLATFFNIFVKCNNEIENCYILPADADLIQDLATEGNLNKHPYKIKNILNSMSDLGIVDKELYKFNLIYMPIIAKIDKEYFLKLLNDFDFYFDVNLNLKVLYNKYVCNQSVIVGGVQNQLSYNEFLKLIPITKYIENEKFLKEN